MFGECLYADHDIVIPVFRHFKWAAEIHMPSVEHAHDGQGIELWSEGVEACGFNLGAGLAVGNAILNILVDP
jgi:hypothetical protein